MKIEVGKRYSTRGGHVAKITGYVEGRSFPYSGLVDGGYYTWTDDGRRFQVSLSNIDLIATIDDATLCAANSFDAFNAQAEKMGKPVNEADISDDVANFITNEGGEIPKTFVDNATRTIDRAARIFGGLEFPGDLLNTRAETHGSFDTNSHVSQCIKAILRDERGWERLKTTQQEALDHICGKIGRIMAGDPDHADHWIDIAGYAQLAARDDE